MTCDGYKKVSQEGKKVKRILKKIDTGICLKMMKTKRVWRTI